eukprot:2176485-Pleurochrysis_carterae.AAC.3
MAGGGAVKIGSSHERQLYKSTNVASRDIIAVTRHKRQRWRSAVAVGVRSHLAATIADRANTLIQSICEAYVLKTRISGFLRVSCDVSAVVCFASRLGADCSGEPETNVQRAHAHQIRSAHQLIRLWQVDYVCRVTPFGMYKCLQARSLAIDVHSMVSVTYIASQVRSHLARTSPSTCFGSVAASFYRSGSTMTAQLTSSWPLVLDSPVGTLIKHSLSVVTVHIYRLLTSQQLDKVDARASPDAPQCQLCA